MNQPAMPLLCAGLLAFCGCIDTHKGPANQPVTAIDPRAARADYWLDLPAVATVEGPSFALLWDAAAAAAEGHGYALDRTDQRSGLLTTKPLICKQVFELWRNDVPALHDQLASTLATMRRTVHFKFMRNNKVYRVEPMVLVERYTTREYHPIPVARVAMLGTPDDHAYWYAFGRDHTLEIELAESIRGKL